ncbi:hypothetical protein HDU76_003214 [Blyttiomyces sp. JEL0837]|nr:hypothetical protein HDU76_003214 [Blyttiomyces sp. JEL0837]
MVGQIASAFLDPETVSVLEVLLPEYNGTIVNATIWADQVKGTPLYKWSAGYHYVDFEDVTVKDLSENVTSSSCVMTIDEVSCPGGVCVTNAIYNYTERADVHGGWNVSERNEAVKFLTHYIGDITQPLHNCGKLLGGNGFLVKWNGSIFEPAPYSQYRHNLHFIWDQFMVEADIFLNYNNSFANYVNSIVSDIRTGIWKTEHHRWTHCENPVVTKSGRVVRPACPLEWAKDANDFNCDNVWNLLGSSNNDTSVDLFENGYYAANKDIARKQIAKAGLRLASVLNSVVPNNGKLTRVN